MRKLFPYLVLLGLLLLNACQKKEEVNTNEPFPASQWTKFEIPGAVYTSAMAGSIDTWLITANEHVANITTDQGKTWRKIDRSPFEIIFGFHVADDTIYPLTCVPTFATGEIYVSCANLYMQVTDTAWKLRPESTRKDGGFDIREENLYDEEDHWLWKTRQVDGIHYKLTYANNKHQLLRVDSDGSTKLIHEFANFARSIYLDAKGHVYVGLNSASLLYVSKQSFP